METGIGRAGPIAAFLSNHDAAATLRGKSLEHEKPVKVG
jgi:hypothetical protein